MNDLRLESTRGQPLVILRRISGLRPSRVTVRRTRDLAFAFPSQYVERTGDYAGIRLLSFYAAYRALVRAMVDALAAEQNPVNRAALRLRLQGRIKAAADFVQPPSPTLFIMQGPSGAGKSWMSERLLPVLEAVRIRSDLERKRPGGVGAPDRHDAAVEQDLYTPEASHRTYARLAECAESWLQGGVTTIVDAAFLSAAQRRPFRDLAARLGSRYMILSCQADASVMTDRIATRRQMQGDPSDADVTVLHRQLQLMQVPGADERSHVISVDTRHPQVISEALAAIRRWVTVRRASPIS